MEDLNQNFKFLSYDCWAGSGRFIILNDSANPKYIMKMYLQFFPIFFSQNFRDVSMSSRARGYLYNMTANINEFSSLRSLLMTHIEL